MSRAEKQKDGQHGGSQSEAYYSIIARQYKWWGAVQLVEVQSQHIQDVHTFGSEYTSLNVISDGLTITGGVRLRSKSTIALANTQ